MSPHSNGEAFLNRITKIVGEHLGEEQFGVSDLARGAGMSRSNLHRKIHSLTGKSASQFIRELRLNKAHELLQDSGLTVAEVAYKVGFSSATYFSKCFHDHFGYPPGEAGNLGPFNELSSNGWSKKQIKEKRRIRTRLPWLIVALVATVAAAVVIMDRLPALGKSRKKSVVLLVLPLRNDSPDHKKDFMINGLMEEIMTRLSSIEGLSVVSRTTSEAYRNTDRSLKEIGKDLQADYVLEGSATILNNQTRIRIQLIEAETDTHIWAEPFERVLNLDNLIEVQEEVAMAVASDLRLILAQEYNEQDYSLPAKDPEAYKNYLLAREILDRRIIQADVASDSQLKRAKQLLERAISLDSNLLEAYLQLSGIFIYSLFYTENAGYSEKAYALMDSGRYYADKVLSLYEGRAKPPRQRDLNYAEALNLKGRYYAFSGDIDESERYFNEAHNYMQMTFIDYENMADGCNTYNNYYGSIMNYLKAKQLEPTEYLEPHWSIRTIYNTYNSAGFPKLARKESQRLLDLNGDTIEYYNRLAYTERCYGNYEDAIAYLESMCRAEPENAVFCTSMSRNYIFLRKDEQAIQFLMERIETLKKNPLEYGPDFIIGYVYLHTGLEDKGDSILNNYIDVMSERCKYPLPNTQVGYNTYNVARAYSILGNKGKTLEYLEPLKKVQGVDLYLITELEDWPTFDFVRDTPEFQEVLSTLKKRFNDTHEQIARLLKDHGITPG